MLRNLWDEHKVKIWIGLGVGLLIVFLVDIFGGYSKRYTGKIVDKVFTPERSWTTVEMVAHHSGKTTYYTPAVRHHYRPPQWDVYVRSWDEVVCLSTSSNYFYSHNVGASVPYKTYYGRFTGWAYTRVPVE